MNKQIQLDKEKDIKRANAWLNEYAKNNTSQFGEDGIIEKILDIIPDSNQWCVEFGCWDGKKYSNTYNLITEKKFSAILIEASKKKFSELVKNYGENEKVVCINKFVGLPDVTIILDIDPRIALERKQDGDLEKFESLSFLDKVRSVYLARAKEERYVIINSDDVLELVQEKIQKLVINKIKQ